MTPSSQSKAYQNIISKSLQNPRNPTRQSSSLVMLLSQIHFCVSVGLSSCYLHLADKRPCLQQEIVNLQSSRRGLANNFRCSTTMRPQFAPVWAVAVWNIRCICFAEWEIKAHEDWDCHVMLLALHRWLWNSTWNLIFRLRMQSHGSGSEGRWLMVMPPAPPKDDSVSDAKVCPVLFPHACKEVKEETAASSSNRIIPWSHGGG